MTVSEFKRIVADWPEIGPDGEPREVWLETGHGLSGPCLSAEMLNCRKHDDGSTSCDMLLCRTPE